MALLHDATVTPSKLQLLDVWLPSRPWFTESPGIESGSGVEKVASYRFDDPAGEVGLEAILVSGGGITYQVPMTYRSEPLAGADAHLVGTMEHSVLGPRWAYDACADPVWVSALATVIRTGGTQAEQYFDVDGRRQVVPPLMTVRGSGTATGVADVAEVDCRDQGDVTVSSGGGLGVALVRRIGTPLPSLPDGTDVLTGSWSGSNEVLLAFVR
jgi:hypothetical protein